jgi:sigma-E factor negative regulatory protein RseB
MLGAGVVSLLARHYSLDTANPGGKVAGREVDLVQASRTGGPAPGRVAARFWLDRDTGLILRREVYDERGRPTRASAFVDIAVRRADFVASAGTSSFPKATDESLDMAGVARMRAHGWTCPKRLPGPLTLVDARRKPNSGVLQLSYADGLSSVSVFQQPGRLDEEEMVGYRRDTLAGRDVWVREEVPVRVLWSADGRVFTLLADAPQRTVVRAVAALSARHDSGADTGLDTGAGSAWERLGRGLDRVASWFNPH